VQKLRLIFFVLLPLSVLAQNDTLQVSHRPIVKQTIHLISISESFKDFPKVNRIITYRSSNYFRDNFFLFLLNLFLISVLLLQISKEKVKKLLSTLFRTNVLTQYSKVEIKRDNNYLFAYFILVLVFISLLIFIILKNMELNANVIYLVFLVVLFFSINILVHSLATYIFNLKEIASIVHFSNYSFLIVILPLLIISLLLVLYNQSYTVIISNILILLLAIFYLWSEIRNIIIFKANKINIYSFYFFLYLCTFKLIPLVIFVKIAYTEIIKT